MFFFTIISPTGFGLARYTVVAQMGAQSLIHFTALLAPVLVQDRLFFETWCMLFSILEIQFIHYIIVSCRYTITH